ncbi:MAG: hypothetical protein JW765_10325 [Deltaproteobacteria bacterium]|nr:hypothetical protein [Candidatus Zymogenaceae bacterium]
MRLPNPLKKGLILYGDQTHEPASPERLVEYGTAYESEGRDSNALECFWQAGFTEGIQRIALRAIEEGDFFLYRQAMVYMERAMVADELLALSRNAEERGKLSFALAAAREAGDGKRTAALEAKIPKGDTDGEDHKE